MMRIPTAIVESLKAIVPIRGLSAYQSLQKSCAGEGLRRDEARFDQGHAHKLADTLKRRGLADRVIKEALAEIA